MIAAGNGHTPFVRFLLDENVDPGVANKSGERCYHKPRERRPFAGDDCSVRVSVHTTGICGAGARFPHWSIGYINGR